MKKSVTAIFAQVLIILAPECAFSGDRTEQIASLNSYTCSNFLSDVADPNNSEKIVRTLMMISWATGYVAAYDQSNPRSDGPALVLVGKALQTECETNPAKLAPVAIADLLNRMENRSSFVPKELARPHSK
jgi:hypothetical protein